MDRECVSTGTEHVTSPKGLDVWGGGVCDLLSVMQECGQFAMGIMAQVIGTLLVIFSHFLVEK